MFISSWCLLWRTLPVSARDVLDSVLMQAKRANWWPCIKTGSINHREKITVKFDLMLWFSLTLIWFQEIIILDNRYGLYMYRVSLSYAWVVKSEYFVIVYLFFILLSQKPSKWLSFILTVKHILCAKNSNIPMNFMYALSMPCICMWKRLLCISAKTSPNWIELD